MMNEPKITALEVFEYTYSIDNLGLDESTFNMVYEPGGRHQASEHIIKLHTDAGITGEYAGGKAADYSTVPMFWNYLKGKSILQRERIYNDVKRSLRQVARIGMAVIDNALWDAAGKYFNVPLYKLLGGYKEKVPCYASTYHGDRQKDGLSTPEAYGEFALQCKEMGYPAFKIHGWYNAPIRQEMNALLAIRKAVGEEMDLMVDPACELTTFGDAVQLGKACDDARYYWLEDPFRDGGISQFAHRKLRQLITTPLLLTEHVRTLEPHVDFVLADATDFVRGDIGYDGITGVMKLAHACEGLGIDIEFHGPGPGVRHCMASIRNTNYYEMGLVHPKAPTSQCPRLYTDFIDSLEAVDSEGCVPVPQNPGFGAEIDWEWVKKHQTGYVKYE